MAVAHLFSRHIGIPEAVLALLVAAGLILPFVPIPGEHSTRIAVRFRTADMPRPGGFVADTSSDICYVLSKLISFRDPRTGEFVQIECGRRAAVPVRRIPAARTAGAIPSPTLIAQ